MKFSLKKFKRKIAANSQTDIDVYGDKVFARSVPAGCKIKFDDGEAVDFYTGLRFGVNSWLVDMLGGAFPALAAKVSSNVFRKISIVNDTAAAVVVEVIAGFGDIADDSTVISGTLRTNAFPQILTMATQNIAANAEIMLPNKSEIVEIFVQNIGDTAVEIYPSGLTFRLLLKAGDSVSIPPSVGAWNWKIKPLNAGETARVSYINLKI